ncbi:hypothetical protein QBC39DRAFT_335554 [Podospora conica]|nr:hypothetical protein QBC39DRAFT_335554 [Schizothecium conicum]
MYYETIVTVTVSVLAALCASVANSWFSGTLEAPSSSPTNNNWRVYRDWLGVILPISVLTLYETFDILPTATGRTAWKAIDRRVDDAEVLGIVENHAVSNPKLAREVLTENQA